MPRRKRTSSKPKRPLTAYMFFSQEKRPEIKRENQNVSFGDIGKLLGEAWQKLSEEDRKPYEAKAKQAKAEYTAAMAKYKVEHPNNSDEERPKKRRKKKDKDAPKKPCSAFVWFSKEQRPIIKKKNMNASFGDMGRLIGAAWQKLGEEDRKPYQKKAEEDKIRYGEEMKNYKPPRSDSDTSSSSEEEESSSSSEEEESSSSEEEEEEAKGEQKEQEEEEDESSSSEEEEEDEESSSSEESD